MLIEDDQTDVFICKKTVSLIQPGVVIKQVSSGVSALSLLKELKEKSFPSTIIVDLVLPMMDGFAFLDIYQQEYFPYYPETRLFVLSSSVHTSDRLKSESYACVEAYFSKPMTPSVLESIDLK